MNVNAFYFITIVIVAVVMYLYKVLRLRITTNGGKTKMGLKKLLKRKKEVKEEEQLVKCSLCNIELMPEVMQAHIVSVHQENQQTVDTQTQENLKHFQALFGTADPSTMALYSELRTIRLLMTELLEEQKKLLELASTE